MCNAGVASRMYTLPQKWKPNMGPTKTHLVFIEKGGGGG